MEDQERKRIERERDQIDFFAPLIMDQQPLMNVIQNPYDNTHYNTGLPLNQGNPYGQPDYFQQEQQQPYQQDEFSFFNQNQQQMTTNMDVFATGNNNND